jgi:DNA polymerase III sliding clamp (beta) subunit (PCNA family)
MDNNNPAPTSNQSSNQADNQALFQKLYQEASKVVAPITDPIQRVFSSIFEPPPETLPPLNDNTSSSSPVPPVNQNITPAQQITQSPENVALRNQAYEAQKARDLAGYNELSNIVDKYGVGALTPQAQEQFFAQQDKAIDYGVDEKIPIAGLGAITKSLLHGFASLGRLTAQAGGMYKPVNPITSAVLNTAQTVFAFAPQPEVQFWNAALHTKPAEQFYNGYHIYQDIFGTKLKPDDNEPTALVKSGFNFAMDLLPIVLFHKAATMSGEYNAYASGMKSALKLQDVLQPEFQKYSEGKLPGGEVNVDAGNKYIVDRFATWVGQAMKAKEDGATLSPDLESAVKYPNQFIKGVRTIVEGKKPSSFEPLQPIFDKIGNIVNNVYSDFKGGLSDLIKDPLKYVQEHAGMSIKDVSKEASVRPDTFNKGDTVIEDYNSDTPWKVVEDTGGGRVKVQLAKDPSVTKDILRDKLTLLPEVSTVTQSTTPQTKPVSQMTAAEAKASGMSFDELVKGQGTPDLQPKINPVKPLTTIQSIELAKKAMPIDRKSTIPILKTIKVEHGEMMSSDLDKAIVQPTTFPDGLYHIVGKNLEKSDLDIHDFPRVQKPNQNNVIESFNITLSPNDINRLTKSASTNIARPTLTGILFHSVDGNIMAVATDSYRLSVSKVGVGNIKELIIPADTIKILKSKTPQTIKVSVYTDGENNIEHVSLDNGQYKLLSRTIEGMYPDYQHIIPKEYNTEYSINRKELISALKEIKPYVDKTGQISIIPNKNGVIIKTEEHFNNDNIKVPSKEIWVHAQKNSGGLNSELNRSLIMPIKSDNGAMNLNYKYLEDLVHNMNGDLVNMRVGDDSKPFLFVGSSKPYIIKPTKIAPDMSVTEANKQKSIQNAIRKLENSGVATDKLKEQLAPIKADLKDKLDNIVERSKGIYEKQIEKAKEQTTIEQMPKSYEKQEAEEPKPTTIPTDSITPDYQSKEILSTDRGKISKDGENIVMWSKDKTRYTFVKYYGKTNLVYGNELLYSILGNKAPAKKIIQEFTKDVDWDTVGAYIEPFGGVLAYDMTAFNEVMPKNIPIRINIYDPTLYQMFYLIKYTPTSIIESMLNNAMEELRGKLPKEVTNKSISKFNERIKQGLFDTYNIGTQLITRGIAGEGIKSKVTKYNDIRKITEDENWIKDQMKMIERYKEYLGQKNVKMYSMDYEKFMATMEGQIKSVNSSGKRAFIPFDPDYVDFEENVLMLPKPDKNGNPIFIPQTSTVYKGINIADWNNNMKNVYKGVKNLHHMIAEYGKDNYVLATNNLNEALAYTAVKTGASKGIGVKVGSFVQQSQKGVRPELMVLTTPGSNAIEGIGKVNNTNEVITPEQATKNAISFPTTSETDLIKQTYTPETAQEKEVREFKKLKDDVTAIQKRINILAGVTKTKEYIDMKLYWKELEEQGVEEIINGIKQMIEEKELPEGTFQTIRRKMGLVDSQGHLLPARRMKMWQLEYADFIVRYGLGVRDNIMSDKERKAFIMLANETGKQLFPTIIPASRADKMMKIKYPNQKPLGVLWRAQGPTFIKKTKGHEVVGKVIDAVHNKLEEYKLNYTRPTLEKLDELEKELKASRRKTTPLIKKLKQSIMPLEDRIIIHMEGHKLDLFNAVKLYIIDKYSHIKYAKFLKAYDHIRTTAKETIKKVEEQHWKSDTLKINKDAILAQAAKKVGIKPVWEGDNEFISRETKLTESEQKVLDTINDIYKKFADIGQETGELSEPIAQYFTHTRIRLYEKISRFGLLDGISMHVREFLKDVHNKDDIAPSLDMATLANNVIGDLSFKRYFLHREGMKEYSYNIFHVVKQYVDYMNRRIATDKVAPLVQYFTEKLAKGTNDAKFLVEWMNDLRGIKGTDIFSNGSALSVATDCIASAAYLGSMSLPLAPGKGMGGVTNLVAGIAANYIDRGTMDFAKGIARNIQHPLKSKRIMDKYMFAENNFYSALHTSSSSKKIAQAKELLYIHYGVGEYAIRAPLVMSMLTPEEWNTGEISIKRVVEIMDTMDMIQRVFTKERAELMMKNPVIRSFMMLGRWSSTDTQYITFQLSEILRNRGNDSESKYRRTKAYGRLFRIMQVATLGFYLLAVLGDKAPKWLQKSAQALTEMLTSIITYISKFANWDENPFIQAYQSWKYLAETFGWWAMKQAGLKPQKPSPVMFRSLPFKGSWVFPTPQKTGSTGSLKSNSLSGSQLKGNKL